MKLALMCKTCREEVELDDQEAVRYYSQSEQKHHAAHGDCWRHGKPMQQRRQHARANPSTLGSVQN